MFGLSRVLTVYAIAIPLALVLGYLLATPGGFGAVRLGTAYFY
jgi:hypothetical protein